MRCMTADTWAADRSNGVLLVLGSRCHAESLSNVKNYCSPCMSMCSLSLRMRQYHLESL